MELTLNKDYSEKLDERLKEHRNVIATDKITKVKKGIFFKLNEINGGDIDWPKTLAYSNSPD